MANAGEQDFPDPWLRRSGRILLGAEGLREEDCLKFLVEAPKNSALAVDAENPRGSSGAAVFTIEIW